MSSILFSSRRRTLRIPSLVLLLVIVLTACAPAATPASTDTPTPDPFLSNKVTVDVGGRSLNIYCFGAGSPVVVLEGGLGTDWTYWEKVYTGIPPDIRVCMYNRSTSSKTSLEFVNDLHALLAGAHLEGPYILVGHSFGGMTVILYANRYPDEVAGIVLEDISHPDQFARFLAVLPPESPDDSSDLKTLRQTCSQPDDIFTDIDWTTSSDQVRAVKSLGDIPLIVLNPALSPAAWGDIPADIQAKLDEEKQAMQEELPLLSSNSTRIIATTTSHNLHLDEPQLVIDAILTLVNAARSK
jgi:pimeloyl-ACP methyl ester carboxylesterase